MCTLTINHTWKLSFLCNAFSNIVIHCSWKTIEHRVAGWTHKESGGQTANCTTITKKGTEQTMADVYRCVNCLFCMNILIENILFEHHFWMRKKLHCDERKMQNFYNGSIHIASHRFVCVFCWLALTHDYDSDWGSERQYAQLWSWLCNNLKWCDQRAGKRDYNLDWWMDGCKQYWAGNFNKNNKCTHKNYDDDVDLDHDVFFL